MTLTLLESLLMFVAGGAIGMAFFGGLRWTIKRLPEARYPFALALGSLMIRTALLMGALILLGQSEWQRYIVLLIGIIVARLVAVRLWGLQRVSDQTMPKVEGE